MPRSSLTTVTRRLGEPGLLSGWLGFGETTGTGVSNLTSFTAGGQADPLSLLLALLADVHEPAARSRAEALGIALHPWVTGFGRISAIAGQVSESAALLSMCEYFQRGFAEITDGGTRLLPVPYWQIECTGTAALFSFGSSEEVARVPYGRLGRSEDSQPPLREAVKWIKDTTGLSQERIGKLLGVSRQTLYLWEQDKPISDENWRRLLGVVDVLRRAAAHYRTPEQLRVWLDLPRGPEGLTPAEVMESGEIGRARALAISTPSSGLRQAAPWVNRPVPETFRRGAERRPEPVQANRDHEFSALVAQQADPDEDVDTILEE